MKKWISLLAIIGFAVGGANMIYAGGDGVSVFKSKCGYCHSLTYGGKSVASATTGPDLTGIVAKRGEDYVRMYIIDPDGAKKKFADVYEKEVKGKYNMKMPAVRGISDAETDLLLEVLK